MVQSTQPVPGEQVYQKEVKVGHGEGSEYTWDFPSFSLWCLIFPLRYSYPSGEVTMCGLDRVTGRESHSRESEVRDILCVFRQEV